MKFPDAKTLSIALHLLAEAQRLLDQAELKIPLQALPGLLRELADKLDKENETSRPQ